MNRLTTFISWLRYKASGGAYDLRRYRRRRMLREFVYRNQIAATRPDALVVYWTSEPQEADRAPAADGEEA